MASLTGQTISSTYDSLLKVTDNGPLNSSLKTITDGLGNSSSLQLSTVAAYITGGLTVTGQLTLPGAFDLTVNGFTIGKGPGALNNTVYGFQSLLYNTTGVFNTANGYQALYNNTIGEYNTAFGLQSMFSNVAGGNNVGIGANALPSNTSGNNNTAIGRYAGFGTGTNNNITGSNNIFIGYQSVGISSSESNRTWIGNSSTLATWVGGNLLVGGTTNNGFGLEVTGTAKISGQLTLGSTITNGTYTYTLPSATGTLALTSDIHSAVTLSAIGSTPNANAATLTGQILNLEPASASFGGVVTTGTQTFAGDKTLTGSLYGIALSMTGTVGDIIGSIATTGKAIRGTATTGFGVYASATTGTAIYGESTGIGGAGINGTSGNGIGGYFLNNATGFATLYVTNNGSGNLASFSNSAGTKFTINNAGNLGNGTYTYTLPSATGTLALTSALSSYLPLTGGTLSNNLTISASTGNSPLIFTSTTASSKTGYLYTDASLIGICDVLNGGVGVGGIFFNSTTKEALVLNNGSVSLTLASSGAATFSSSVTGVQGVFSASAGTYAGGSLILKSSTGTNPIYLTSNGGFFALSNGGGGDHLLIASTGAATFSSSVTAGGTGNIGLILRQGSSATDRFKLFVGSGSPYIADDNYISSLNTDLHFLAGGSGTTEIVTFKSGGNVGIGTTSPSELLHLNSTTTGAFIRLQSSSGSGVYIGGRDNNMELYAGGSEKMRITSGGVLCVNKTTAGNTMIDILNASGKASINCQVNGNGDNAINWFNASGTYICSIVVNASSVSYNTTSDYRLKQDLKDFEGLNLVDKIKVYDYEWKIDNTRAYGVVAHELEQIIPQAVSGVKDDILENGEIKSQGVDYSKLVPILIKSIQELKAEIDLLKGEPIPTDNNLE